MTSSIKITENDYLWKIFCRNDAVKSQPRFTAINGLEFKIIIIKLRYAGGFKNKCVRQLKIN